MRMHRVTEFWLAVAQAAAVIEARRRAVAREFELEGAELLVLAWLAQETGATAAQMARGLGRRRQHVHRSLVGLRERGLVEPLRSVLDGGTAGWALTERGERMWRGLDGRLALEGRRLDSGSKSDVDLAYLVSRLRVVVEALRRGPVNAAIAGDVPVFMEVLPPRPPPEWDL